MSTSSDQPFGRAILRPVNETRAPTSDADHANDETPVLRHITDVGVEAAAAMSQNQYVAVAMRLGIRAERTARSLWELRTEGWTALWGLASDRDLTRLAERVSALDARIRELEQAGSHAPETGGQ